jgi:hypothetical protein
MITCVMYTTRWFFLRRDSIMAVGFALVLQEWTDIRKGLDAGSEAM